MNWRTFTVKANGTEEVWRGQAGNGTLITGKATLDGLVARWQPTSPLLICPPGSDRFLPVLEVEQYRGKAFASAQRIAKRSASFALCLAVIFAFLWLTDEEKKNGTVVLLLIGVSAYLFWDLWAVVGSVHCLSERARYFTWVHRKARPDFWAWLIFVMLLGVAQYYLQNVYGGRDTFLLRWGTHYEAVRNGEWFRLLTGPLLHSGFAHWVINSTILVVIAPVIGSITRRAVVIAFFLSNFLGALVAVLLSNLGAASGAGYVGMSAGVLGIIGCGIGISLRQPSALPSRLNWNLLGFATISMLAGWVSSISNAAHLAGFTAGILLGAAMRWGK